VTDRFHLNKAARDQKTRALVTDPFIRVVGLDLSLTASGIATIRRDGDTYDEAAPTQKPGQGDLLLGTAESAAAAEVRTITSKGKRADSLSDRHRRLNRIGVEAYEAAFGAQLVVVEGPSVMSQGGSNWDRAGLWWRVIGNLLHGDTPIAIVAPTQIKKFATGRGTADKTAVAVAMARMWPGVNAADDNQWDALTLAHIGAARLGYDVPQRAHHPAVLAAITWPEYLTTDEEPMRA
jgi:crossover junction endodeoxyribonuclease RuvC